MIGINRKNGPVIDEYGRINYDMPGRWNEAYTWYTDEDTPALNEAEQKHMVQILNQKRYNLRLFIIGAVWIAVFIILLLIDPMSSIHEVSVAVKALFVAAHALLYLYHMWRFVVAPYDLCRRLLPELAFCTFAYLLVWQL